MLAAGLCIGVLTVAKEPRALLTGVAWFLFCAALPAGGNLPQAWFVPIRVSTLGLRLETYGGRTQRRRELYLKILLHLNALFRHDGTGIS